VVRFTVSVREVVAPAVAVPDMIFSGVTMRATARVRSARVSIIYIAHPSFKGWAFLFALGYDKRDVETLEFTLPDGVWDVIRVRCEHTGYPEDNYISSHFKEQSGKIKFDYGYAPEDGYVIRLYYRDQHAELTSATSEIDSEINTNWLKYKAAEHLLNWAMGIYKGAVEYRIEERMNLVLAALKGKLPRRGGPLVIVRTAGG